jgi:Domain of unknown function (DUF4148)
MNKYLACFAVVAGALSAPVLSYAQSVEPLTRAQVRADLIRVEQAGYVPSRTDDANYPADIQAAEAKVAAQDGSQAGMSDYGGAAPKAASSAGVPMRSAMSSNCVGPASFCDTFFGN